MLVSGRVYPTISEVQTIYRLPVTNFRSAQLQSPERFGKCETLFSGVLFWCSLKEEILETTDEKEEDQEDQHGLFSMDFHF